MTRPWVLAVLLFALPLLATTKKATGVLKQKCNGSFATAVAMDGGITVVGCPGVSGLPGAVYVFQGPKMVATLTGSDDPELLGANVAISGTTIVAGGWTSKAYVFNEPEGGWQNSTETAQYPGGFHLALSGNMLVTDINVFVEPQGGWVTGQFPDAYLDRDGGAIAISEDGQTIIAGNGGRTGQFKNAGMIHVYPMPQGGWQTGGQTIEPAAMLSVNSKIGCGMGYSVAISQNVIVGGCPKWSNGTGAVEVFVEPQGGWVTAYPDVQLTGAPSGAKLGSSISMNSGTIMAGAPNATVGTQTQHGEALAWVQPQNGWVKIPPTYKFTPAGKSTGAAQSVSTSQGHFVLGWPQLGEGFLY